jgi:hypothetical protein
VALVVSPEHAVLFPVFTVLALLFGVLLIIPIGGADMPTVIALLNSYAGLSASAMGFVLNNKLLIVAGALDGSSGLILADHHVPGHEPILQQRAFRRFRTTADYRRRVRRRGLIVRPAPKRRRRFWTLLAPWS